MSREISVFLSAFLSFRGFLRGNAAAITKLFLVGVALAAGWVPVALAGNPEPGIAWVDDLDQAMQLAKIHNKPLMIHFYGDHCPPCRMLEAKAFRNRDLILALNDHVIAVKVNADQKRDVALAYQVTRWPTDVYLQADGTVMERGVSNQDPQAYTRTVTRVAQRHRDWALSQVASKEAQERRDERVAASDLSKFRSKIFGESAKRTAPVRVSAADWGREPTVSGPMPQGTVESNSLPPNMQVIRVEEQLAAARNPVTATVASHAVLQSANDPMSPMTSSNQTSQTSQNDPSIELSQESSDLGQVEALAAQPGLGGFCPVALQDYLKMTPEAQAMRGPWVLGKEEYSVRHRGRVYRCASAESRERLLRDPDSFTPVFSGCDLVEFARSGVLVEGKCNMGFIEQNTGRVFLFATRSNYEEFARNCERYSSLADPGKDRMAQGQSATNVR